MIGLKDRVFPRGKQNETTVERYGIFSPIIDPGLRSYLFTSISFM